MTANARDGIARGLDELATGTMAGDYVVDRRLGGGAMGDVYAGHHPVIGKKVAIKVIKRELASRADSAERFLREARAVNQIDHANVVDVFALGRLDDGRLYLVMDLLDGESLRARLQAGPVAPDVALAILGQIAQALDAAHARGVVHRDLKPDNIMLTGPAARPSAHVLDFGIAKLVADAAGERALETLTGQGAWLGTPAYMAPEQWSADGATAASDRYALGIVAFEMLTGKPPFAATTLPGMMEQHFRGTVPSVTSSGVGLHPSLDRAFARALAKDPERRPATAALVVTDLEAALAGKLAAGRDGPRWSRGAMLAAAAGALVAIAGGVIVVGGVGRERAERRPSAGGNGARARDTSAIQVTTTPAGARVRRDGVDLGVTPHVITDAQPGQRLELVLSKPGYATVKRSVTAAAADEPVRVEATLALVAGFEGVWSLPDGGFRQFERRGDQVAGFSLAAATGDRAFLRMFEFVPTDDSGVAFTATEPFVDERAPDEPSCNIPLRAEYSYHPGDDSLELRKEKAQYTLDGGRCVLQATAWSEPRALARVAGATADAVWAESRAGAGGPQIDDDANRAAEEQKKNVAQKKQKTPPPPSKNPAKQVVNEPEPPPQQEVQQQKPIFKK
ncbi:MAG TPA: serine/threonine-protein kinase [Kofleriaceae bacterium]|nr:serine/threonine-protein kinase [Kofleriaceae bacterium]